MMHLSNATYRTIVQFTLALFQSPRWLFHTSLSKPPPSLCPSNTQMKIVLPNSLGKQFPLYWSISISTHLLCLPSSYYEWTVYAPSQVSFSICALDSILSYLLKDATPVTVLFPASSKFPSRLIIPISVQTCYIIHLLKRKKLLSLFLKLISLFIYFWLRWVFIAVHGLSLVAVSAGYFSLRCVSFSLRWLLLLWSMGSRCTGFSSCGSALVVAHGLSCSAAYGIFPDQGSNPCPLHWQVDS